MDLEQDPPPGSSHFQLGRSQLNAAAATEGQGEGNRKPQPPSEDRAASSNFSTSDTSHPNRERDQRTGK